MSNSRQPAPAVNPYSGSGSQSYSSVKPTAGGYIPPGTNYTQPVAANAAKSAVASVGGGAAGGAVTGLIAGSAVPIVGNILGAIAGATIGGIFDWVQGDMNRKQQEAMFKTQQEMAERQFDWGQKIDRFNMGIANRQQYETEKMNKHSITKDSVDRLNQMLRTSVDLQNQVRSLWGGK